MKSKKKEEKRRGGDPNRVTMMQQTSAGGGTVDRLQYYVSCTCTWLDLYLTWKIVVLLMFESSYGMSYD
jgi:hypothetical protein